MHPQIEHYINIRDKKDDAIRLIEALKSHDESYFLRDIDVYAVHGCRNRDNVSVTINKISTNTFINVGLFSKYYMSYCYESAIFENNKPTGGSHWITHDSIATANQVYIHGTTASGKLYIFSDTTPDEVKRIINSVKQDIQYRL